MVPPYEEVASDAPLTSTEAQGSGSEANNKIPNPGEPERSQQSPAAVSIDFVTMGMFIIGE
jgi:hypothetical protein